MFQKSCFALLSAVFFFFFVFVNQTSAQSQLSASPTSINFGSVSLGSSAQQQIKLTNSGRIAVLISSISTTGSFSVSGVTTPIQLAAGASTTFTSKFAPTTSGSYTGTIAVQGRHFSSPFDITLTGTGTVSIVPSSASFGTVPIGSSSSQTFTVTNRGSAAVTITASAISGIVFSLGSSGTSLTVAAGQSATFNIAFKPSTTGTLSTSATLFIASSGSSTTTTSIPLSGTAVAATAQLSVSPTSLNFGSVALGKSSTLPLKLTNSGNSSIAISRWGVTGSGFGLSGLSGLTLQAGQSDTLEVVFDPTATGNSSGTITIVTSLGTESVSLSGSGVASSSGSHTVSLTWGVSTSSNVTGYFVERATASGGPYQVLNSSPVIGASYVDSTVQDGKEYFYVVVTVSNNGEESSPSKQVSATIPSS